MQINRYFVVLQYIEFVVMTFFWIENAGGRPEPFEKFPSAGISVVQSDPSRTPLVNVTDTPPVVNVGPAHATEAHETRREDHYKETPKYESERDETSRIKYINNIPKKMGTNLKYEEDKGL